MKQCKRCQSTDITYVTNYEHWDVDLECSIISNGYICEDCETFHEIFGKYFEYYSNQIYTGNIGKYDKWTG